MPAKPSSWNRPQTHADRDEPRCPTSWWVTAPRDGWSQLVEAQQPRQRKRGITYYADLGTAAGRSTPKEAPPWIDPNQRT